MSLSEGEQELLEQLWMAAEENGGHGVPDSAAPDDAAAALVQAGLAVNATAELRLTDRGHVAAAEAIRRHRLAERLLADVLTTDESALDEQACRLEHALVEGLDDGICTLLGHPQFCPHGKPIPRGTCCRQMRDSVPRLIMPLAELEPGQSGGIAYIHMNDASRLQKLMALGVLPGVDVRLIQRFPSFVFEAGHSQFAVDEEIAGSVYVRVKSEP